LAALNPYAVEPKPQRAVLAAHIDVQIRRSGNDGQTAVGAHFGLAPTDRLVLDPTGPHRLDIGVFVVYRPRGMDIDEVLAEHPLHGREIVGRLGRVAGVIRA
jgi:hypothetical protein